MDMEWPTGNRVAGSEAPDETPSTLNSLLLHPPRVLHLTRARPQTRWYSIVISGGSEAWRVESGNLTPRSSWPQPSHQSKVFLAARLEPVARRAGRAKRNQASSRCQSQHDMPLINGLCLAHDAGPSKSTCVPGPGAVTQTSVTLSRE